MSNCSILSLYLPLEVGDHHSAHPHLEGVHQVQLVMNLLTCSSLIPPVLSDVPPRVILEPHLGSPDPKGVKVGHV